MKYGSIVSADFRKSG